MSSTWNHCLCRLENEIPASEFNTWVRPLQVEENARYIKLFAPNRFVLDWIKQHYASKLNQAIEEFSAGQLHLRLEIGSKNQAKISSTKSLTSPAPVPQLPECLNGAFTFEQFVTGASNQLACESALQVSENLGKLYNPLFIYGHSGLGKTHLLHAIGHAAYNKNPHCKIVYLHSEKFVQDMVKSLKNREIEQFKTYYRSVDLLLLDDIQFLAGKKHSQEEFFHTFNDLVDKKHQIVISCDQYPKEIKGLEEKLRSRLGWGLPVSIKPPDMSTRTEILIEKARLMQVVLPKEIAVLLAKRIPSDSVCELEGILRKVIANAQLMKQAITTEFVELTLKDLLLSSKNLNIDRIQKTVADYFHLTIKDLKIKSRKQSLVRPRQLAMALARELTQHSYTEIGDAFGMRDHSTVMNACSKVAALSERNPEWADDYNNLLKKLCW
ncbi:MAG: hypothetical protein RL637_1717 [Pseudomonadota bacterium]|jgi:chromosomal replication initiator protein